MKLELELGLLQLRLAIAQIVRARLQTHLFGALDELARFGGFVQVPLKFDQLWERANRAEDEFRLALKAYLRAKRRQFVPA